VVGRDLGAVEALYAAFVLVLVLGLRKGEVLGLGWDEVQLDGADPELRGDLSLARELRGNSGRLVQS